MFTVHLVGQVGEQDVPTLLIVSEEGVVLPQEYLKMAGQKLGCTLHVLASIDHPALDAYGQPDHQEEQPIFEDWQMLPFIFDAIAAGWNKRLSITRSTDVPVRGYELHVAWELSEDPRIVCDQPLLAHVGQLLETLRQRKTVGIHEFDRKRLLSECCAHGWRARMQVEPRSPR